MWICYRYLPKGCRIMTEGSPLSTGLTRIFQNRGKVKEHPLWIRVELPRPREIQKSVHKNDWVSVPQGTLFPSYTDRIFNNPSMFAGTTNAKRRPSPTCIAILVGWFGSQKHANVVRASLARSDRMEQPQHAEVHWGPLRLRERWTKLIARSMFQRIGHDRTM